jgi:hypothetical protein
VAATIVVVGAVVAAAMGVRAMGPAGPVARGGTTLAVGVAGEATHQEALVVAPATRCSPAGTG